MIKVLAISGYKSHEMGIFKNNDPSVVFIKKALRKELIQMADEGLEWVIISGQLGVELWAAEVVFEMQTDYPHLQLAVLTPFLGQELNWNDTNKEWYESILAQADFVDSITKKPYENPSQLRVKNQFFLGKSDALLLLYDPEKEGTPKFLFEMAQSFRQKSQIEMRLITFYDIQAIVEDEQNSRSFE